jgi:hypothetical protein
MSNRLRTEIQEEEAGEEIIAEEKPARGLPDNFFTRLFIKGIWNPEEATRALPFVLFLAFLGMLYIANRHLAERNIRDIDKINKEIKELTADYKASKADLAYKSTLSEVERKVDTLGIKVTLEPPQKITVKEVQDEH